jgi:hypothetical protein
MAFLECARPVPIRWLRWSGLLGSLAGNPEGKEGYELDLHGPPPVAFPPQPIVDTKMGTWSSVQRFMWDTSSFADQ